MGWGGCGCAMGCVVCNVCCMWCGATRFLLLAVEDIMGRPYTFAKVLTHVLTILSKEQVPSGRVCLPSQYDETVFFAERPEEGRD